MFSSINKFGSCLKCLCLRCKKNVQQNHSEMCFQCNNNFLPENIEIPYENCEGEWVDSRLFEKGFKSFGFFLCLNCFKWWLSAHSLNGYGQACISCNVYHNPKYMWINYNQKSGTKKESDKPHRKDLCEACRLGKCIKRKYDENYNFF